MMGLAGQVMLGRLLRMTLRLMAVVLLVIQIRLVVWMGGRWWGFAGGSISERPDFGFRGWNWNTTCYTIGLNTLVLEMVFTYVALMMMTVVVLWHVVEGHLSAPWIILKVQVVIVFQILVVLHVFGLHMPHGF